MSVNAGRPVPGPAHLSVLLLLLQGVGEVLHLVLQLVHAPLQGDLLLCQLFEQGLLGVQGLTQLLDHPVGCAGLVNSPSSALSCPQ